MRRHARALEQRDHVARRAQLDGRRRRRVEDVDDGFRRQEVAGRGRLRLRLGDDADDETRNVATAISR